MLECKLNQIVRENHINPFEMRMHTHKFDELVYFISGNGTTRIHNHVYNYKPHTFAFYKAGTPHDEINAEPCDIIWLHFSYNIKGLLLEEGVYEDPDAKLLTILQKLRNSFFGQEIFQYIIIESQLAHAIVIAAQQNTPKSQNTKVEWQQIINYIDTNFHNDIDFKELARRHNYSFDRFRHIFREHFGISIYAYLTSQRINLAKRLLKSSNFSIARIAYDCGFNSSSQFTNIFKKHTGLTPKEYRKIKTNIV